MSLWGRVFAAGYDSIMRHAEQDGLRDMRLALLAGSHGRVLEIGAGTGANLELYPARLDQLVLSEPEAPMATRLQRKLADSGRDAELLRAPAQQLPFPAGSFDCAVSTLVLCTVQDQAAVLGELHRVLRPGGRLLFLEHVRSEHPRVARTQDLIDPLWRGLAHGCNCNRATLDAIRTAGFELQEVEHSQLPRSPAFLAPLIIGTATR